MQYAHYEIGTRKDAEGNPLFLADGKIVGTVGEVKAVIERFEARAAPPRLPHAEDWQHIRDQEPATVADVKRMIAANNHAARKQVEAGGRFG
jgi:hypothetical protein